jgi:hypothetical protein
MMIRTFKAESKFVGVRYAAKAAAGSKQQAQRLRAFGCGRMGTAPVRITRSGPASCGIKQILGRKAQPGQSTAWRAGQTNFRFDEGSAAVQGGSIWAHACQLQDWCQRARDKEKKWD